MGDFTELGHIFRYNGRKYNQDVSYYYIKQIKHIPSWLSVVTKEVQIDFYDFLCTSFKKVGF